MAKPAATITDERAIAAQTPDKELGPVFKAHPPSHPGHGRRRGSAAGTRWREDDQGIWEMRDPPRPLPAQQADVLDGPGPGIAMAELPDATDRVPRWSAQRAELREIIVDRGWNDQVGRSPGTAAPATLGTSVLLMAIVGFTPPDVPRLLAAIDAIEADLADDRGLLYRYRGATASKPVRPASCCARSGWPTPWP